MKRYIWELWWIEIWEDDRDWEIIEQDIKIKKFKKREHK